MRLGLAAVGSFELLMTLIRNATSGVVTPADQADEHQGELGAGRLAPPAALPGASLAQTVRDWHHARHSQRVIARELKIGRRKVKKLIERPA